MLIAARPSGDLDVTSPVPLLVHASCVAINGLAVLLRGPSGAGKSDLALRLIEDGALLVADDQTEIVHSENELLVRPPAAIAGRLEVRGLGILRMHNLAEAPLALVVDLVPAADMERLPEPATVTLLGLELPSLRLDPFAASAAAKVRLAVRVATGSIIAER